MAFWDTLVKVVKTIQTIIPPKIRGAAVVATVSGVSAFARATWDDGVKYAFKAAASAGKATFTVCKTAKFAKAMNIIGVADIAGDLLVNSDADGTWWNLIPGAGIIQFGAAVINSVTGTELLKAKFFWDERVAANAAVGVLI